MSENEFDLLIDRYFEGELSDREEAGLWDRVRRDSSAADRFVEQSELESALHERYRERAIAPPTLPLPVPRPPAQRRWALGPLAAAAAVLIAVGAFAIFVTTRGESPAEDEFEAVGAGIPVIERVAGEVFVVAASGRTPAAAGQRFFPGSALETAGPRGRVVLQYADETRVEMQSHTLVRQPEQPGDAGKRLVVTRGTLRAEVSPQPSGSPLRVTTPHGEALVKGTRFWLVVEPGTAGATRVSVTEGNVRLSSAADGKVVELESGFAAGTGTMVAERMEHEDIRLFAADARLVGAEWTRVKDPDANTGTALDVPDLYRPQEWIPEIRATSRSWAEFAFYAEADREYRLQVRARCMNGDHKSDWVVAELIGGEFVGRPNGHQGKVGDPRLHYFNGYFLKPGYHWIDGDIEQRGDEDYRDIHAVVRFARSGLQILRLHAKEGPLRVSAVHFLTKP